LARALPASDESAAAYQTDVSTSRLGISIQRRDLTAAFSSTRRSKRISDHCVLVSCDIRTPGSAEIEYQCRVSHRSGGTEVSRQQAAHIFGHGYTQIAGGRGADGAESQAAE